MILAIIAAYFIFIWDCKITYTDVDKVIKIEYNGLVWVALDYYSIIKYKSSDIPKKWISLSIDI